MFKLFNKVDRITPIELKQCLDSGEPILIVDVRDAEERKVASLGGIHIPLSELPSRCEEIPRDKTCVLLCHHGIRSAHAAAFLKQQGWTHVLNLSGGIDRWSLDVDPSLPRY